MEREKYDNWNFIDQIYNHFDTPERPLDQVEFAAFWYSLTPEEVLELRSTPDIWAD